MELYRKWSPTGFDSEGLAADGMGHDGGDRGDWLVLGVSQNRDSGPLARSNFQVAREILKVNKVEHEVHRFGHWGPGWFEIILIHPDGESRGDEIEGVLADYPVLSDEHLSQLESDEAAEAWGSYACNDFVRALVKEYGLCDATEAWLWDRSNALYELHAKLAPGGEIYTSDDSGVGFDFRYLEYAHQAPSRDDLATWIRKVRAEERSEKAKTVAA